MGWGLLVVLVITGTVAVLLLGMSPWLGWRLPVIGVFSFVLFMMGFALLLVPATARFIFLPFAAAFVGGVTFFLEHWNAVLTAKARLEQLRSQRGMIEKPDATTETTLGDVSLPF